MIRSTLKKISKHIVILAAILTLTSCASLETHQGTCGQKYTGSSLVVDCVKHTIKNKSPHKRGIASQSTEYYSENAKRHAKVNSNLSTSEIGNNKINGESGSLNVKENDRHDHILVQDIAPIGVDRPLPPRY